MAVLDDNWNYRIDNLKSDISGSNSRVSQFLDEFLHLDGFRVLKLDCKDISPNNDEELKSLTEQNKQLRNEIAKKREELSKQKKTYDTFKKDQKLLTQEIKDTHEAFLTAKKYFKMHLNIYYTIESREGDKQVIFLQFFTEVRKESQQYFIRLLRDAKTDRYELMETVPKLKITEELKKFLQETNDLPKVLCSIRQAFIKVKTKTS